MGSRSTVELTLSPAKWLIHPPPATSVKDPLQLLVEILAAVDQMHDNQLPRMVQAVSDPILRFASSEMERVEHVKRAREALTGKRVPFKNSTCVEDGFFHELGKPFYFFSGGWGDVDAIAFVHLPDCGNRFILSLFGLLQTLANGRHGPLVEQQFECFEFRAR